MWISRCLAESFVLPSFPGPETHINFGAMHTKFKIYFLSLGCQWLYGCGTSDLTGSQADRPPPEPDAAVVLATDQEVEKDEVEPGSYIVAFRAAPGASFQLFKSFQAESRHHSVTLAESYLSDPRVTSIRYLTTIDLATAKDPRGRDTIGMPRALHLNWTENDLDEIPAVISQVDFTSHDTAAEVLKEWERTGDIWYAEPNGLSRLSDSAFSKPYRDADISWQTMIKLPAALDQLAEVGTPFNPVIAILDSGVDVQHPDLKNQIWQRDGYEENASGCGDDRYGCDTTKAERDQLGTGTAWPYLTTDFGQPCPQLPSDKDEKESGTCAHGTHVAGLAAASFNAKERSGGVCPVCKILPIKIIAKNSKGFGTAEDAAIIGGLKYLTRFSESGGKRSAVRIANSSFGKYPRSRTVALLVRILSAAPHEILVVGAASNEDSIKRSYPGALEEALGVASVDASAGVSGQVGAKSVFSNYGPWVDVSAPGGDPSKGGLNSTGPGGKYLLKRGTSMASPVAAGVVGLVLALPANQSLGFSELRDRIIKTADPSIYAPEVTQNAVYNARLKGDPAPTPLLGSGVVDALAAMTNQPSQAATATSLKRVDQSCGTLGVLKQGAQRYPAWLILLVPLMISLATHLRRKKSIPTS